MEKKNGCARAGFSTILWGVLAILLCATPSLMADVDIPSDGKEYNIPGDFGPAVSGNLWVYGTVNLLPDAVIELFVYATGSSIVNIKGGEVGSWIDVAAGATVTVYGTGFKVDGEPASEGSMHIDGTLTVLYENATDPVNLGFDCQPEATVTLAAPGGGEEPQIIEIDIKPGSYPNSLNINGHGVIPVAILGSADFDVTQIDPNTLRFADLEVRVKGNGAPQCSIKDVSGDFTNPEGAPDGYPDLVCQFVDDPDTWLPGDGVAKLTGNLLDGTPIEGTDEIIIVRVAE